MRVSVKTKKATDSNPRKLPLFWNNIQQNYRLPEVESVKMLLEREIFSAEELQNIESLAFSLIETVRSQKLKPLSIENFLQTHQLSSQEGLALMCLAEALLRIPDAGTKTRFIRDKVNAGDWQSDSEDSLFAKLANLGLLTTTKFLNIGLGTGTLSTLTSLIRRFGEPVIRKIMVQAMRIMGQQFVMAETIGKALERASEAEEKGYRHSYDMLGEAARTQADADRYFQSYLDAASAIGQSVKQQDNVFAVPSLSVKLSALHPRYELAKKERVLAELPPKVLELAKKAKEYGIGLTIDAEESERLTLSLEIFEKIFTNVELAGWEGLGLAVQAYQKRAPAVIDWLVALAEQNEKRLSIRLVKGAYWDSEIKRTQERGLTDYPVYTQKVYTDVSYLHCAEKMLTANEWIYPQFATHNAYTLSAICEMARVKEVKDYEFQRLHGMGESLYQQITEKTESAIPCRVYAPVGAYRDLLAYLVRRLLENGANSSFVNQIHDAKRQISTLIEHPFQKAKTLEGQPHPKIPLPKNMLLPQRLNSDGLDLWDEGVLKRLEQEISSGEMVLEDITSTDERTLHQMVNIAKENYDKWSKVAVEERAQCLERLGHILQQNMVLLMRLLIKEGGKTINDALAEVREAVDFCYYYAQQARQYQGQPTPLPGPTGELNQLTYHSRGVFVCISPWNFPLAIFLGQITAALVTGNTVIAKPAAQTPHIARYAVELAYKAGIPQTVLQLAITSGKQLSDVILHDPRVSGVAFTGSTETAHAINLTLAQKKGAITPFLAETGGINAMIVDSSALLEQVVNDVIISAFQSAGQRCSALRLLLVQNDIADELIEMLQGAMAELTIGNPSQISTDVGPVIDSQAKMSLSEYIEELEQKPEQARLLCSCTLPEELKEENYIAPQIWQLPKVNTLTKEIFGPILHLVRYKGEYLDQVIEDINALGYGLTLGIHSRLESTIQQISTRVHVGNIYVNRNMIGAVVGVQPFGGEGLSGTGPKAGGPNYLLRFMAERTFTQDTTAAGGNASLLAVI